MEYLYISGVFDLSKRFTAFVTWRRGFEPFSNRCHSFGGDLHWPQGSGIKLPGLRSEDDLFCRTTEPHCLCQIITQKPQKLLGMNNPDVKHELNWAVELCSALIRRVTGHVCDGGVTTLRMDEVKLERFSVKSSETETRLKTDGLCRGKRGKRALAGMAWWFGVCRRWNTDRQVFSQNKSQLYWITTCLLRLPTWIRCISLRHLITVLSAALQACKVIFIFFGV